MEEQNLEQVKELINRIADSYDLPTDEQVSEMHRLTGIEWDAEDLQMSCCEYWSHNSLEETAYLMFHESYPPVSEVELGFWSYKSGAVLDDDAVYEKYRLGGNMKALESLPYEQIIQDIKNCFPEWQEDEEARHEGWCFTFNGPESAEYWKELFFSIYLYSTKTDIPQMMVFTCHNMDEEQINQIIACMEKFNCQLRHKEELTEDCDEEYDEE